jgi:hypothetical protein
VEAASTAAPLVWETVWEGEMPFDLAVSLPALTPPAPAGSTARFYRARR